MDSRPHVKASELLVIELGRLESDQVRLVISIPGREGAVTHVWPRACPWEDVQASILSAVADWLLLSGGHQEGLPF